jgi:hypothetical protein
MIVSAISDGLYLREKISCLLLATDLEAAGWTTVRYSVAPRAVAGVRSSRCCDPRRAGADWAVHTASVAGSSDADDAAIRHTRAWAATRDADARGKFRDWLRAENGLARLAGDRTANRDRWYEVVRDGIWHDTPGGVDLVAKADGVTLLIEAKGGGAVGGVESTVGRVLHLKSKMAGADDGAEPALPKGARIAVLLPQPWAKEAAWVQREARLANVTVIWVSADGSVTVGDWRGPFEMLLVPPTIGTADVDERLQPAHFAFAAPA